MLYLILDLSYPTNFSSNAGENFSALIFAESEISTLTLRPSSAYYTGRVFLSRLFFSRVYYFVITNKITRTLFAFSSLREWTRGRDVTGSNILLTLYKRSSAFSPVVLYTPDGWSWRIASCEKLRWCPLDDHWACPSSMQTHRDHTDGLMGVWRMMRFAHGSDLYK